MALAIDRGCGWQHEHQPKDWVRQALQEIVHLLPLPLRPAQFEQGQFKYEIDWHQITRAQRASLFPCTVYRSPK